MTPLRVAGAVAGAVAAATVAVSLLAGCPSSAPTPAATTAAVAPVAGATTAVAAPVTTVNRWWSNDAASAGSAVDVSDPGSAATKLHPSRTEYCGMLRQTLAAGHSILAGIEPTDPQFAAATTAFVTELQRVAPSEVAPSWHVLGDLIVTLVSGRTGSHPDASTIRSAVATVSADAKTRCGMSLSRAG